MTEISGYIPLPADLNVPKDRIVIPNHPEAKNEWINAWVAANKFHPQGNTTIAIDVATSFFPALKEGMPIGEIFAATPTEKQMLSASRAETGAHAAHHVTRVEPHTRIANKWRKIELHHPKRYEHINKAHPDNDTPLQMSPDVVRFYGKLVYKKIVSKSINLIKVFVNDITRGDPNFPQQVGENERAYMFFTSPRYRNHVEAVERFFTDTQAEIHRSTEGKALSEYIIKTHESRINQWFFRGRRTKRYVKRLRNLAIQAAQHAFLGINDHYKTNYPEGIIPTHALDDFNVKIANEGQDLEGLSLR